MITQLDFKIDAAKFLIETTRVLEDNKIDCEINQVLLTHKKEFSGTDRFLVGANDLRNGVRGELVGTREFSYLAEEFKHTIVDDVIREVKKIALRDFKTMIGRVRLLRLKSKTCYSLHIDKEEFRFHIPLITNRSCFFVCGNELGRMEEVGRLYLFKTNLEHTAVNASHQERLHLVFDTWTWS